MAFDENELPPDGAVLNFTDYFAGLFDGEGCFMVNFNKSKGGISIVPRIKITSTNKEITELLKERLGGGTYPYNDKKLKVGYSPGYGWYVSSFREIERIVHLIDQKLTIKRDELKIFKEILKIIKNKRVERGIARKGFSKDEVLKIAELRDKLKNRHGVGYRNKLWFEKMFSALPK